MSAIMTTLAIEAALRLVTLIGTHAREAGRLLGEWLRPWLREGEVLPDFTLVLQLPVRMIEEAGKRLSESEKKLAESRGDEGEARDWRDHQASMLRRKLVETRRHFSAVYGPRHAATLLGIEGKTAQASQKALLLSQADGVLKVLRDPRRLAIPDAAGFDPAAAAAALEPLVAGSREAYGRLEEVHHESAARLAARDQARADLDRGLPCVVSILSGWLGLIRRADLAEKLRYIKCP